jgi:hypothetical protein
MKSRNGVLRDYSDPTIFFTHTTSITKYFNGVNSHMHPAITQNVKKLVNESVRGSKSSKILEAYNSLHITILTFKPNQSNPTTQ